MINVPHRVYFVLLFYTQNIINHLVFWDRHHVNKIHHSFRSQSMTLEPLPKPRAPHVWRFARSLFVWTWEGRWEARPVTRSTSTPVNLNPLNAELNPICHLLALLGAHHIFHVSGLRVNIPISWNMLHKRKFYHARIFFPFSFIHFDFGTTS